MNRVAARLGQSKKPRRSKGCPMWPSSSVHRLKNPPLRPTIRNSSYFPPGAPSAAEIRFQGDNMSVKKEASGRRSIQVEVEVPGTPEEVWQAIATGPGISAWFTPAEFEEQG